MSQQNVVYDEIEIRTQVAMLAQKLKRDLELNQDTIYVCVMTGGVQFFHDLTKQLPAGICYYTKASSYENNVQATDGSVHIQLISKEAEHYQNRSRRIVIIDDICDTGNTLDALVRAYHRNYPMADITTVVLLYRHHDASMYRPNYAAIETDSTAWFAGYGLDNNGRDRNLPYIYAIDKTEQ